MLKFIVRRIFWTIPVLLVVIFLTFIMMRQIEGNPFRQTERAVPEAVQQNLERKFNLDKPWWQQYLFYVKGVATLDFGPSLVLRGQSVNDIMKEHFPKSIELGVYAFLFAIVVGVPLGMVAALRQNTWVDYSAMFFSNIFHALPSFLVATLMIYFIALKAGLLPTSGWTGWQYKILPAIALGFAPMALFARLVRGTMLETLQQDYVRTARAKGLRYRRVVGLHVQRCSFHGYCLRGPAHGHLKVLANAFCGVHHNARPCLHLKALRGGGYVVGADLNIGKCILADVVRRGGFGHPSCSIGDLYSHIRKNTAGRIGYGSNDCGGLPEGREG